jgi:hypothetical protein
MNIMTEHMINGKRKPWKLVLAEVAALSLTVCLFTCADVEKWRKHLQMLNLLLKHRFQSQLLSCDIFVAGNLGLSRLKSIRSSV